MTSVLVVLGFGALFWRLERLFRHLSAELKMMRSDVANIGELQYEALTLQADAFVALQKRLYGL